MKNLYLIAFGKFLSFILKFLNLGNGSTWPGHLALKLNPNFLKDTRSQNPHLQVIFVIGTNGKTTTTSLIRHILDYSGRKVIQNMSGANMLNGIASTLLLNSSLLNKIKADFLLFEIDENSFPLLCQEITPNLIVALNLFRDQLDRYGEVNTIFLRWQEAIKNLPRTTQLILNADDPLIAYLGKKSPLSELYFGVDTTTARKKKLEHQSDSTYCPNCGEKLAYSKVFFSHLGVWKCNNCQLVHPQHILTNSHYYPLSGLYNKYNTHAANLAAGFLGITDEEIRRALKSFSPMFGRQEVLKVRGKEIEIILAKNPTGFDQALETVIEKKGSDILLILNDKIADGTDISWIWDTDVEIIPKKFKITVSGTRVYDLALRLKYAQDRPEDFANQIQIEPDLEKAIQDALKKSEDKLYILPTYTAMLDVRKILTGKKIL